MEFIPWIHSMDLVHEFIPWIKAMELFHGFNPGIQSMDLGLFLSQLVHRVGVILVSACGQFWINLESILVQLRTQLFFCFFNLFI